MEFSTLNNDDLQLQDQLQVNEVTGYLPIQHPLVTLPPQFEKLEQILQEMPFYLSNQELGLLGQKKLSQKVDDELPDYYDLIETIENQYLLTALFRDYGFLTSAYLLEDCHLNYLQTREYGLAKDMLPKKVARPFSLIAKKIGASPWLDYSRAMTLYNYQMIDVSKGFDFDNMRLIRQFSGNDAERGFHLTHVMVASRSPKIVKLINQIFSAAENDSRSIVDECLQSLEEVILQNVAELKEMFSRNYVEDYYKFLTYFYGIKGQKQFPNGVIYDGVDDNKPQFFKGPSAALDLTAPILDTFLGLNDFFPDTDFKMHLVDYRSYMPKSNLEYLEKLLKQRNGSNIIAYYKEKPSTLYQYLKCVEAIKRQRETHWTFVMEYLIKREKDPVGSSGTHPTSFLIVPIEAIITYILDQLSSRQRENESDEERAGFEELEKRTLKSRVRLERDIKKSAGVIPKGDQH